MNTEKATPDQVFALAGRFATEVNSWGLPRDVVLEAKEKPDHPLWGAIRDVLVPKPEEKSVVTSVAALLPNKVLDTPRIQVLCERPKPCAERTGDDQVASLKDMYAKLGWEWTESSLIVPMRKTGFDRLIIIADTTLTKNQVFDVCKLSFSSWKCVTDLDTVIPVKKDQRHPAQGPYAIWVKDEVDSDHDLCRTSADMIQKRGLKTITLLERMILEVIYFRETCEHLDLKTWTLCSGSRDLDNDVPCVVWDEDGFGVSWYKPGHKHPGIRARQAVTL